MILKVLSNSNLKPPPPLWHGSQLFSGSLLPPDFQTSVVCVAQSSQKHGFTHARGKSSVIREAITEYAFSVYLSDNNPPLDRVMYTGEAENTRVDQVTYYALCMWTLDQVITKKVMHIVQEQSILYQNCFILLTWTPTVGPDLPSSLSTCSKSPLFAVM